MGDHVTAAVVTIVLGIVGLASLAVIFSPKARTTDVIRGAGSALANDIMAAVSPITGTAPSMMGQF